MLLKKVKRLNNLFIFVSVLLVIGTLGCPNNVSDRYNAGEVTIQFTYVPPYGSFEDLQGEVLNVVPRDYKVAVYIFVSGWWTKPTFANPLTIINTDGSWTCDITTGGMDQNATKIAAFLITNGYDPPLMDGKQILPSELYEKKVAHAEVERTAKFREIEFSGFKWKIKASDTKVGPGPNFFSDKEEDIWLDEAGQLHMKISQRDGEWYCTEVINENSLGYGKYIFKLSNRVDQIDKNVVLGLFTWDDSAPEYHYREIDIEFARWEKATNENAQYVIQPWDTPGNMIRFNMDLNNNNSTHFFIWQEDSIVFQSVYGHSESPTNDDYLIKSWIYKGDDIPPTGNENVRVNLWLSHGNPPSDGKDVEVIVKSFEFIPLTK